MKETIDYRLLGKRILEWRKQFGITQESLAFIAEMSVPYLSQIENGKKKPSLETLLAVANGLGITLDEIMTGNQLSHSSDYQSDIDYLLYDCSPEEKRLLYETIKSLKQTIRNNNWIVQKGKQ